MEEPEPAPPCSTPHSAPVAWLDGFPDSPARTDLPTPAAADCEQSPNADRPPHLTPGDYAPFTPELKVRFCEALAETGLVTAACRAVGKHRDTIYEHLRTDALFAAACDASRHQARHRLADRLMEDSIAGSVDHFYRDGVLVGERRYTDNRLAYAMLRRLDKLAQEPGGAAPAPGRSFDPKLALKALRTGAEEDLAAALATFDSDTSDNPPFEDDAIDDVSDLPFGTDRVWEEERGEWWTDFPPPEDFDGEERGHWSDEHYARECSGDECDLLNAAREAELADLKADEESERNSFFTCLRTEANALACPG
jgi:hypothetical protein